MTERTGFGATVVGKVRLILEALADAEGGLGLSELTRRSGIPKASVHRVVADLVEWGVVERAGDGYRLGPRLFELGNRVPRRRKLREAALPFMVDLTVATGQTVHLAVLDGLDVLYVERLPGKRAREVPSSVAARLPLNCTAGGKCVLAFGPSELVGQLVASGLEGLTPRSITSADDLRCQLDRIRETGVAVEHGEVTDGVASLGAPVFELGNRLVAALSVTGPEEGFDEGRLGPAVRLAAAGLSRRLGHRPVPDGP